MSNLWTRHLPITDPPWRIQDPHRGTVYDAQDRRIATVAKAGEIPFEERMGNLNTIALAPELLALCRNCAYLLHQLGYPLKPEYYDLINRATPHANQLVPPQGLQTALDALTDALPGAPNVQPTTEASPTKLDQNPDLDQKP